MKLPVRKHQERDGQMNQIGYYQDILLSLAELRRNTGESKEQYLARELQLVGVQR